GADLLGALLGRDDLLALHVPAALRPDLILDHDAREARLLERAHREVHVHGVAIAGIGIGEQRQIAARRDGAADTQVLLHPHHAEIGPAEAGLADAGTGDEARREAGRL